MPEKSITLDQVRHVAKLSRLALDEAHLQRYAGQLGSILGYVAKLQSADVSGVEPTAHAAALTNVLRDDVAAAGLTLEQTLQNAPETDGQFFKVPKILGGDEDSAG